MTEREATQGKRPLWVSRILPYLLVLAGFVALYTPSLMNEMVWDDRALLVDSVGTSNPNAIGKALTTPYLEMIDFVSSAPPFYRPFSMALLMIERQIFGTDPLGYRIIHSLIHLLNILLVFGLTTLLSRDQGISRPSSRTAGTFASLMFLSLPYTVEAVCFLTDLGDLLALAALLTSVLIVRSYLKSPRIGMLVVLSLVMLTGVTSKESAAAIPGVLLLFWILYDREKRVRRIIAILVSTVLPIAAFLIVRMPVISAIHGIEISAVILRFPHDLMYTLRWSLIPYPEVLQHPLPEAPHLGITVAGVAVLLVGTAAVWRLRRRDPMSALSASTWLITLAPSMVTLQMLLIFPTRYLYVPAAWLAILAGRIFAGKRRLILYAAVMMILSLGLITATRIQDWKNNPSLWSAEIEVYPNYPYNMTVFAKVLEDEGKLPEATAVYSRVLESSAPEKDWRSLSYSHQQLAKIMLKQDRIDEALTHFEKALKYDDRAVISWIGLGNLHGKDGSWDKALICYERALSLRPEHFGGRLSRAGALAALGRYDEAFADLDKAAAIASGDPDKLAEARRRMALVRKLKTDRQTTPGPTTK